MIRIDFIFSYWIFLWFLLYILGIIKYNPLFGLIIALIENIILLMLMIYYKASIKSILLFVIINFFIKVLPVIYLIKKKIIIRDIIATFILFIIYLIWLYINNKNTIYKVNKEIFNSLIKEKSEAPLMYMINKLEKYIKNKKM